MRIRPEVFFTGGAGTLMYGVVAIFALGQPLFGAACLALGAFVVGCGLLIRKDSARRIGDRCRACGATFDARLFLCPRCGAGR